MNPMNLLMSFMGGGGTPQQFILNALKNNQNPMLKNLVSMAQKGNSKDIETFARNYCKENGMDFDKDFKAFMNQMNQMNKK